MRLLFVVFLSVAGCAAKPELNWRDASCNVEVRDADGARLCIQVEPEFPKKAVSTAVSGMVAVKLDVGTNGLAENVVVINSYPEGVFESSAVDAVNKWIFIPRILDGAPEKDKDKKFVMTFHYSNDEPVNTEEWMNSMRLTLQNLKCKEGGDLKTILPCHSKVNKKLVACVDRERLPDHFDVIESGLDAVRIGRSIFDCVYE